MVEIGEPPLEELFAALAMEESSEAPPADVPVEEPEGKPFEFIELNRVEEKAPATV